MNVKNFSSGELEQAVANLGLKPFRARQIFSWIHAKGAGSFEEMTNLSKHDRALLAERFSLPVLALLKEERSSDGTRKFLFKLEDEHKIESVLIPDEDRNTLCISSQVGCAQACRFCVTGGSGFERNLKSHEISDQVLTVEKMLSAGKDLPEGVKSITNIVLMGMGEPLANLDEVLRALRIITSQEGLGFSPRRITVSTSGLVPEIEKLGQSDIKVNLAVSLNATDDEVRSRIMPVNRRYPIRQLLDACKRYPLEPRRRITFEYVLLGGLNDLAEDAFRLVKLLRGIKCKVNLIPYNPSPDSEFRRPTEQSVKRFQQILLDHHYTAPVRESRGRDISAACGQLREREAACPV